MTSTACRGFFGSAPMRRREFLRAGSLGLFGLSLPHLLASRAQAAATRTGGRAKACILLFMWGGPAQQDTWDMKPDAPAEFRGEFKPIATTVPGLQICEHLPRTAKWMHKVAVVRSVNHKAGCHNCLPSYAGHLQTMPDQHPRD